MKKPVVTHPVRTMYGTFPCIFESEKDMGGYVAEAPAIQGAITWGKTLTEAKRMVAEAIEGVIETRVIAEAQKAGIVRLISRPKVV